ncbi:MAG: MmgE/PrpD family protein [Thermodesulfobacteriota bacterium]|nr:MmgE/PrpD family protein [Thermodesulfobacteriota bacterium]
MDRIAEKISDYAASFTYTDLTPEALHAVKRSLIDSIGCALGAFSAEPVKIARRLAARVQCSMPASILGTFMKTSPEMAAFVNGIMVRYLDFNDDYLNKDGPHPSDNISALLAICEALHTNGKSLACGITLAYEIVDQLVDSAEFHSRGWDYVTETSIGSALGVGNMLGLSQEKMAQALALAIAPNIGLWQTRTGELSMWKGCAGPNAARNGLFAALLASEGMTGPNQIFEGRCGLMKQVTGPFELGVFGGKGHPFKIEGTFFKYRPVMYTVLLSVETALELRKKVDIHQIDSIRVFLDSFSIATSSGPEKYDPHTRETADHSIPYLVVAALFDGEISERTYTPERYRHPQILALLKKSSMEEDPQYTKEWPKTFHCRIEVVDLSGRQWIQHLKNPKGHPANPMSDDEIEEKFLKLTQNLLTSTQAQNTLELLWHLEEMEDVNRIFNAVLI